MGENLSVHTVRYSSFSRQIVYLVPIECITTGTLRQKSLGPAIIS